LAAKINENGDGKGGDEIDVSTFDWVGAGILYVEQTDTDGDGTVEKYKTPPCGLCHPGGGPAEYPRDPATGLAYAEDGSPLVGARFDDAEAAALAAASAGSYLDGDFYTRVNGGGESHWAETGVAEADCLMCHMDGYSFPTRFRQLTWRNYRWAPTAAAGLGTVTGRVLQFADNTGNFMAGTWTGVAPTVAYSLGAKVLDKDGVLNLAGAVLAKRPDQTGSKIYCLFCHEGSDTKKRGFEWSAEYDVHAGNLHCLDCHGVFESEDHGVSRLEHQIGKGYARLGSVRNDLDGTMAPGSAPCLSCHFQGAADAAKAEHAGAFADVGFHLDKLSCEGCHIRKLEWNQGSLIDMSSGKQVWTLSDGTTPTWAEDFQKPGAFAPFLKMYDQDGTAGPKPAKYFPFGAKSSAWFGAVYPNGEIRPIFLRHVSAAYAAVWPSNTGPKVPVLTVPDDLAGVAFDDSAQKRPSVFADADIVRMIEELQREANGHPGLGRVVFVTDVVKGIVGGQLVALEEFAEAESCHDFSINHDVWRADPAGDGYDPSRAPLGAGGCTDCHAPGSALYNPQVREVTTYLSRRTDKIDGALLADPDISESMAAFRGYDDDQVSRLLDGTLAADPADWHSLSVSYALDGANTCAGCHPEAVADFRATVHYASRSVVENPNFFFPGGGKHGMLDRACALVGSNMLLNMLTTSYVGETTAAEQGGQPAQQCGSCHANYYNTLLEGFVAVQSGPENAQRVMLSGVDCLVCHAEAYAFGLRTTYEPDPTGLNAGFGTIGGVPQRIRQDRSGEALDSIRAAPTDDMCLRCHEHGRTDYKRGELPEPEYDIHYKLGVSGDNPCLFCHEAANHKFDRGIMVNGDIFASDYPVNSEENSTSCASCHTNRPHGSARLNDHVAKISCETCHITLTSGAETTVWADGGFLALAKKDGLPRKLYTKKEGGQSLTPEELFELYKQRPVYMPFSGLTSFLAQPIPVTNPNTGEAPRIFPFKTIINPMPFDGRFFGVGPLPDPNQDGTGSVDEDGDGINDYSMFAAMRMFAAQYKALGFMDADFDFSKFAVSGGMVVTTVAPDDPAYPSYAAMAQMGQFPNLLFFDKYTFGYNWYQDLGKLADPNGDGDGSDAKITLWDEAYRPLAVRDMKKAVEVGMARLVDMMFQMGFRPQGLEGLPLDDRMVQGALAQFKQMFALTPDQLVTMAAPPGSEIQAMLSQMPGVNPLLVQNYPAYSNGVTLGGHGVQKEEALFCADCHEPGGVFDQPVEVPTYGPSRMPLFHWEFLDQELLALAEAGTYVDDVEAEGYLLKGGDFEMGVTFVTATQAAAELADELGREVTFGKGGQYLAVLTPTTRLATNWEVLGYSAQRIAELTGQTDGGGGVLPGDVESGKGGSSECFVQTLGGEAGGIAPWLLGALGAVLAGALRRR
jgi:hypothetical protein